MKDKIEVILDNWDDFEHDKTIKEFEELIQEERRDAVEGFVEWYNGEKLFKNVKRMVELKYVEEYLESEGKK